MAVVLVIDDEPQVRRLLATQLTRAGYEVLQAENGSIGLQLFREHQPPVVITDLFMPDTEGIETIQAIARSSPATRIIAISGGGKHGIDVLDLVEGLGAAAAIRKPFRKEALLSAVRGTATGSTADE